LQLNIKNRFVSQNRRTNTFYCRSRQKDKCTFVIPNILCTVLEPSLTGSSGRHCTNYQLKLLTTQQTDLITICDSRDLMPLELWSATIKDYLESFCWSVCLSD